jgi:hypothetical protein
LTLLLLCCTLTAELPAEVTVRQLDAQLSGEHTILDYAPSGTGRYAVYSVGFSGSENFAYAVELGDEEETVFLRRSDCHIDSIDPYPERDYIAIRVCSESTVESITFVDWVTGQRRRFYNTDTLQFAYVVSPNGASTIWLRELRGCIDFGGEDDPQQVCGWQGMAITVERIEGGFQEVYKLLLSHFVPDCVDGAPAPPSRLSSCYVSLDFARFSPDSSMFVYALCSSLAVPDLNALFAVPVDASAPAYKLLDNLESVDLLRQVDVTPDNATVVFRLEDETGVVGLHAVPIDGSAAPWELSGALVAGGNVEEFLVTAGSRYVVYRADAETDGSFALYRVPLDGSTAPTRISGAAGTGEDVLDFTLSHDGQYAVYRRETLAGTAALFSVPVEGGGEPLQLHAGDVGKYLVGLASDQVVYLAGPAGLETAELICVPIDGGGPTLTLNGPLPIGGTVRDFALSPDGVRLSYATNALYSVKLDGTEHLLRSGAGHVPDGPGKWTRSRLLYVDTATEVQGLYVSSAGFHSADTNHDWRISIHELLRVIQFYNVGGYHCAASTEDGFAPGPGGEGCAPHHGDYNPQDWELSLSEVLRIVQFFNAPGGAYHADHDSEDGYAPIDG